METIRNDDIRVDDIKETAEDILEDNTEEADQENPDIEEIPEENSPDDAEEDDADDAVEDGSDEAEEDGEDEAAENDADGTGNGGMDEAADSTGKEKPEGKKGFFSRRKEKRDKKDVQIEELTDRVKRQMAEFDNYRKRTEKEKAAMFEIGAKSVIEKILPVVDNFERGLSSASDPDDPYVQGMQKVYKQLTGVLEAMNVKPIDAVGKEFDPNFHNAVMHVEDDSVGENIVVEELQKGYLYRDSVVRYSMVKVAN